MTHEQFQNKLSDIPNLNLAEKAQSALSKLCRTGGNSFTMTVPPTLDDTDVIFSEVIKRFEQFSFPEIPDTTAQLKADKEELLGMLQRIIDIYPILVEEDKEELLKAKSLIQKHKQ